jgi:hypothetical protein
MARRVQICNCTKKQLERGETCGLASCHNANRRRRGPRPRRHPRLRSDGLPINAVPTVDTGVDGQVLDLLDSHPDFDRSAFAWVGSEHMGEGLYCASIYTGTAADSPYMWIAELAEVAVKTGHDYEERDEGKFLICVFVGDPEGREKQPSASLASACGAESLAIEVLRMLNLARAR